MPSIFLTPINLKATLPQLKTSYNILNNDFVIGFCGRICKEKGIRELIDGFKLFQKENPEVPSKLFLVGVYDKRDILPDCYIKIINEDPDIILTGYIEKQNITNYYNLMNIFVFPSYREGFGLAVIEAAAMKVPPLVSRSYGCIDSIIENETGLYIDISAKSIAEGLQIFLNQEFRLKLGDQGRKNVLNNYDNTILWPQILKFYDNLKIHY